VVPSHVLPYPFTQAIGLIARNKNRPMKCQKCEKPATFHITDMSGPELLALHFCADCAALYLNPSMSSSESPMTDNAIYQQAKLEQTAEDLKKLDSRECPICGISFYEFRQSGRLGCPHDYVCFGNELEPLLINVHGESKHVGKHPQRGGCNTESQTELIRLRREMKEVIEREDYEKATEIRDQIRQIEREGELND